MAGNGTAPGLVVTGTDPVDVLADFDTTTTNTTNTTSPVTSFDRLQQFNADITAEINVDVTVNGFGLALQTTKSGGTISVLNDGTIVVDDPGANGLSALRLDGNGGTVRYSGSGTISNAAGTPNSAALEINNSGDINVEIDGGTIFGTTGLLLHTDGGSVNVLMPGGQIGDPDALVGDGIVVSEDAASGFNFIDAQAIYASGIGISVQYTIGASGIQIIADGTISADTGIEARIGDTGGSTAQGGIFISASADITAVSTGIVAETNQNSTGNVFVGIFAALTVSAGAGISAVAPNGQAIVTIDGSVDATGGNAIDASSDQLTFVQIDSGTVAAHGAGFAGIAVSSNTGSFVSVFQDATVSGDVGIKASGTTADITVEGTVEGTGGTAVSFDPLSANNIFEMETTGHLIGDVIGSGTDTLILCGGNNPAASFDLDQIVSGFTELDKEQNTTWTVTGTLPVDLLGAIVADTFVEEGKLLLANATIGDTQVGTLLTFESALLGGTGTVGDVTVGDLGVLAPGNGILHTGSVSLSSGATFIAHGELDVIGTVDLNADLGSGATLTVNAPLGVGVGHTFVIISNDGSDPVTGIFHGLADGETFNSNGGSYTIHYGSDPGNDGNDVTLTINSLSGLVVTGSGPVHVAAASDVTTEDAENIFTDTITTASRQTFVDDVTAAVDMGVTVNGWGLQITSDKDGGSVFVANHGAVVLDDPAASWESALAIFGSGGLAGYAGDGNIQADPLDFNDGLTIANTGDISAEISGGTINGNSGVVLFATGGAITLDMTGGQIGTKADPAPWLGVEVTSVNADHQDINLTTQEIWAGEGIDVRLEDGTGDINITANGTISADFDGISTGVESNGKFASTTGNTVITTNAVITAGFDGIFAFAGSGGKKSGDVAGDIDVTTNAAITAGGTGIGATIEGTATGNITITANGAISADFDGIFALIDFAGKGGATGGPGDIHITANAAIESTASAGIYAENWRGAIDIAVNANVTSDAVGQTAIEIAGDGSALVTIASGATASGDTGVVSFHDAATLVVSGTVAGTGGTAVAFSNGTNILEMETTGTLIGSVTGAGGDTLVLCGGANAAASFDLNTIVSGFAHIAKEESTTWTVSGTPAIDTSVDEGKLVLANATIGDTTVGGPFTLVSATLGGTGTVGTLTVSDKGILSPGISAGVIHSGDVTFEAGAVFAVELGGTAPGTQYDQLDVAGTVDLGGATLNLSQIGGFHPGAGTHFTIVANDGADAVTGTFSGLAEGAHFTAGGVTYAISYQGGDGNDVVLTALNSAPTDIALSPASVPENSANGTVVGALSDTDPDAGDTAAFSLLDNAGGRFGISGNNLVVANGSLLDFEQSTSHAVTVRVTDGSGGIFDKVLTIAVTDVTELAKAGDFNADNFADLFWTTDSGALAIWEMNSFQISFADYTRLGASAVGLPGSDWHVVDTGDFNGDSKTDILWRTDGGAVAIWEMDGNHIKAADFVRSGSTVVSAPGGDWHQLGAADFDGDGKADILWRTDSGALAIWEMDGFQIKAADYIRNGSTAVGAPAPDWKIVGVGDFDGDGNNDLLWETGSGALAVWQMNGTHIKAADYIKNGATNTGIPGGDWHVADVGDFDGDGRADILWRVGPPTPANGSVPGGGQVAIWEMNGNQIKAADYTRVGSTAVGAPGNDWHLLGSDDYNGDGMNDILWRTDSGQIAIWDMNGTHILAADYTKIGSTNVGAPGADWHLFQHHYDLV